MGLQNCKLYYIYLMIVSEIQSEIGHCSCDSAKFKAPADFSHHAILCMTLSLKFDFVFLKFESTWQLLIALRLIYITLNCLIL